MNIFRRPIRALVPVVLLATLPKCMLCAAGYAGLGAALGLGGPELCGAASDAARLASPWWAALGVAMTALGFFIHSTCRPTARLENLQPSQPRSE